MVAYIVYSQDNIDEVTLYGIFSSIDSFITAITNKRPALEKYRIDAETDPYDLSQLIVRFVNKSVPGLSETYIMRRCNVGEVNEVYIGS